MCSFVWYYNVQQALEGGVTTDTGTLTVCFVLGEKQ